MADYNTSEKTAIVWFDTDAYSEENKETRELLHATLGNNLMIVNDKQHCERMFGREYHTHHIILITSGQLGKELLPKIFTSPRLLSVYIFCRNPQFHQTWSKEFSKIKNVVTSLDELVSFVLADPHL